MSKDSPSPDSRPLKKSSLAAAASQDRTELDLWDMDADDAEESPSPEEIPEREVAAIPKRRSNDSSISSKIPTEREIDTPVLNQAQEKLTEKEAETDIGLEEDTDDEISSAKLVEKGTRPKDQTPEFGEHSEIEVAELESEEIPISEEKLKIPAPSFIQSLSNAEKIGMGALIAILVVSATLAIIHFSNRVPTRSLIADSLELPVKGELIEITDLSTFWREPETGGNSPDIVRRGTKLIPVLKLQLNSKSAAIRILFRNEDGLVIGDAITRKVQGKTDLTIPATAGFDDIGMHAAYRTGESQRWIVEVLEGSNSNASREKFTKVLETEISTDMKKPR